MTTRERFLVIVHFEKPDEVPYWYAPRIGIAHRETVVPLLRHFPGVIAEFSW
ncbi:MAG: hypothetical protein ACUVX8_02550 [Candidatus Zipacnadales bacterium]